MGTINSFKVPCWTCIEIEFSFLMGKINCEIECNVGVSLLDKIFAIEVFAQRIYSWMYKCKYH